MNNVSVRCDFALRTPRLVMIYPLKNHDDKISEEFNITVEGVI